jgi:hypothetical protein
MKWRFPVLGSFLVLALSFFALPTLAQAVAVKTKSAVPPRYDITKEVTLTATVSSVEKRTTLRGTTITGRLVVETSSGKVQASLGRMAMTGKGALTVTPGQQIRLTGIMKTVRNKQIFVTRLVQANGQTYKIRNEHGFALAPAARRGNVHSTSKGGQL